MKHDTAKKEDRPPVEGTVFPPKNGTTQRMAGPFNTEATVDGLLETSVKMMDQAANGELETAAAKAALGFGNNAISAMKLKISIARQLDKTTNPTVLYLVSDMLGGASRDRFRAAIDKQHPRRQIASNQQNDSAGGKSDQG